MTTRLTRAVAAAGLVLAATLSGCGSNSADSGAGSGGSGSSGVQTLESGTLKVCSDIPFKPFDVLDGDTYTGFDGDLVNEIAKGLGLKLDVQDSGFDSLQSGLALNSGQCDLISSAMTITDEREQKLD